MRTIREIDWLNGRLRISLEPMKDGIRSTSTLLILGFKYQRKSKEEVKDLWKYSYLLSVDYFDLEA